MSKSVDWSTLDMFIIDFLIATSSNINNSPKDKHSDITTEKHTKKKPHHTLKATDLTVTCDDNKMLFRLVNSQTFLFSIGLYFASGKHDM